MAIERLRRLPRLFRPAARRELPRRLLALRVLFERLELALRRLDVAVVRRPPRRLLEFEPMFF